MRSPARYAAALTALLPLARPKVFRFRKYTAMCSCLAHEAEEFGLERTAGCHGLEWLVYLQQHNVLRRGRAARHEGAVRLTVQFVIVQQQATVLAVIRPVGVQCRFAVCHAK